MSTTNPSDWKGPGGRPKQPLPAPADNRSWSTQVGDAPVADHSAPPVGLVIPHEFGRYRIRKVLGKGGMGEVYLARDTELERDVALKVPHFERVNREYIARFYREARIAAGLRHPNLCPIFDIGQVGDIHYLTMPLLVGETLADRLRHGGPMAPAEAARVAAKIAHGLDIAHRAGVVHRDLKPANIMIDEHGEPIVMDFGLARRVKSGDARMTAAGMVLGTPGYLAPERIGHEPQLPDPAGDIYSLGVILYEMLTGQLPFQGTVPEVIRKSLSEEPKSPSAHRSGVDPRLAAICLKALAKAPGKRFASMADFAATLEDLTGEAAPLPAPSRRRRPAWIAAAALLIAVGIGALALALLPLRDDRSKTALAHAERAWKFNDDEQMDLAIQECESALKLDDRCIPALLCRANIFMRKQLYQSAIADLTRALAVDPKHHTAHVDLAWAHNALHDYDRALDYANRAVALDPTNAEGFYHRGAAYSGKTMHQEAVGDFTKAIDLQNDYAWAYYNRGKARRALGEDDLAAKDIAKARQLNPALPFPD